MTNEEEELEGTESAEGVESPEWVKLIKDEEAPHPKPTDVPADPNLLLKEDLEISGDVDTDEWMDAQVTGAEEGRIEVLFEAGVTRAVDLIGDRLSGGGLDRLELAEVKEAVNEHLHRLIEERVRPMAYSLVRLNDHLSQFEKDLDSWDSISKEQVYDLIHTLKADIDSAKKP